MSGPLYSAYVWSTYTYKSHIWPCCVKDEVNNCLTIGVSELIFGATGGLEIFVSCVNFLASQDALEVMRVTHWLTESCFSDSTDVTLVSDDTYRRPFWCDPDNPDGPDDPDESDESDLVMKVT